MPLAIKSIKQSVTPSKLLLELMETFRQMVNECIRIGLQHDVSSVKTISRLAYKQLAKYEIISYYKLCAMSHAAGILTNRKKSIKRGLQPRNPYARKPLVISCYGFKIIDGILKIPLGSRQYYDISLNTYVRNTLMSSNRALRIHSFTLTPNSLSVCYSRIVEEIQCTTICGVERNLRNLTVGNKKSVVQYDLTAALEIAENTRFIERSFKRNDVRIRRKLYQKYGLRRKRRVNQLFHRVTKAIVHNAKRSRSTIVFEDIRHIRRLYQRGNCQGRNFRSKLNAWSFAEVKHQIVYKAAWEGLPIIQLSVSETRGTSQLCPECGKKITQVDRTFRQLWCEECKKWMDRDVVAAMNLSLKGLARFASSKGLAGEAMRGNPTTPVILRVDASKLAFRRREPKS